MSAAALWAGAEAAFPLAGVGPRQSLPLGRARSTPPNRSSPALLTPTLPPAGPSGARFWFRLHKLISPLFIALAVLPVPAALRTRPAERWTHTASLLAGLTAWLAWDLLDPGAASAADRLIYPVEASAGLLAWLASASHRLFEPTAVPRTALLDALNDSVIVLDRDERVVDLNQPARAVLGLSASGPIPLDVLGQPIQQVLERCPRLQEQYALVASQPGPAAGSRQTETAPEPRVFELCRQTIQAGQGQPAGYLLVAHDTSSQQQAHARQQATALAEAREQLGSEVHSTLGEALAYISGQTEAIQNLVQSGQAVAAAGALDHLEEIVAHSLASLRAWALGTEVGRVGPDDLFGALAAYLERFQERYGLRACLSLPSHLEVPLTPAAEVQILGTVREALANTRKQPTARSVRVTVTVDDDHLQLLVADDGGGLQAAPGENAGAASSGLQLIHEQATAIGGSCEVRSLPGHGTSVILRVPLGRRACPSELTGLRVLIADGQRLFSEGLHNLLAARGVQVVGKVHHSEDILEAAETTRPDIILMDMILPGGNGLTTIRNIKAVLPAAKVVILTVTEDMGLLFEALQAGACGHLPKNIDAEEFFERLANVARGEITLAPPLAARLLSAFTEESPDRWLAESGLRQLSPRQREVLARVAAGQTYKEVGAALCLSERTIRYHMGEILANLHLNSRAEAIAYARRAGLISDSPPR